MNCCRALTCLLWLTVLLLATATTPDFTLYHTAEQLLSKAAAIQEHNSEYVSTTSCPALPELPVYSLTSQHPHSHVGTDKLRLLLNFGEHGRELITSEVALTLLRFVDTRSRQLERAQKEQAAQQRERLDLGDAFEYDRYVDETDNDVSDAYLAFVLRGTRTTVVPLLNVWGRQRVEAGEACSRKNRNGVDLNRNYDFLHDRNTAPSYDETYAGVAPFTELESQCVAQLASPPHQPPTLYANVHSGIQELYFGWDWTASPPLPNQREVTRMYEHVNNYHCSCKVGAAGKIAGYVVHGGSMDWMYAMRNVSYSLTFEVYGDDKASMGDCYRTFNPQTREALQDTCYRFATSFFSIMQFLIEEKFGVQFPYRPPAFTLNALFMTEDKKTRDAVKVYYHTWKQLTQRFSVWTRVDGDVKKAVDAAAAGSEISLPAFDPHNLLSAKPASSSVASKSVLRVLLIAQNQSNAFFPTELLYHLSHQHATQPYHSHIHLLLLPSLFPASRPHDELCSGGLSAGQRRAVAAELYAAEEEVERVSRMVRPHVVMELVVDGGGEGEEGEGKGEGEAGEGGKKAKKKKRGKKDVFDIFHHNGSSSDAAFVSSVVTALAALHAPVPFTSPLSLSTHLHLRLAYRGYSPPPPDPMTARRRASDRYPPAHYLSQPSSPTASQCDWDLYNPPPGELADHVTAALGGLHAVLGALAGLVGGAGGAGLGEVVVREEAEEAEGGLRAGGLFVDDGLGVRGGALRGRSEWVPSVWESGSGWRGWAVLVVLIGGLVAGSVLGATWIRAKTRSMKAATAV